MTAKSSEWRPGPSVCRCCFAEGCYKDISTEYFWMGKREVYQEMLSETFDVSISYSQSGGPNSNSRLICEPCISRLRDASDFKRQVQECERVFLQHLDPSSSVSELEVVAEPVGKDVKLERVKLESKLSDDEDFDDTAFHDDDDEDLDDQPLTKLASKVPKKESVDLMDLLDNAKPEKRKATAKLKTSPAKKTKKKESPKPSVSKPAPKPAEKKRKDPAPDDPARKNALVILRHSTAYPFQPSKTAFRCCFCITEFQDPTAFREHTDREHSNVDRTVCLKHTNDSLRRVDITDLRCKKNDCVEIFSSLNDLAKHLVDVHGHDIDLTQSLGLVPIRLEKGRFRCVICSKAFSTLHQLSRHTGAHFFRNICYKCGSNFETLKGLSRHIIMSHSSSKFVCSRCLTTFPDIKAKKAHLKSSKMCRSFKCSVFSCNERFLCQESKQEHLEKVHGKQKLTYPCPECGEVFENRTLRYLHFKKIHTDDFKCGHCGSKFGTIRDLKEHVARVHTLERPHRCTVCEKTFTASKTLRRHSALHDDSLKHACRACTKSFASRTRLKYHVQKHHPDIYADVFPESK